MCCRSLQDATTFAPRTLEVIQWPMRALNSLGLLTHACFKKPKGVGIFLTKLYGLRAVDGKVSPFEVQSTTHHCHCGPRLAHVSRQTRVSLQKHSNFSSLRLCQCVVCCVMEAAVKQSTPPSPPSLKKTILLLLPLLLLSSQLEYPLYLLLYYRKTASRAKWFPKKLEISRIASLVQ